MNTAEMKATALDRATDLYRDGVAYGLVDTGNALTRYEFWSTSLFSSLVNWEVKIAYEGYQQGRKMARWTLTDHF